MATDFARSMRDRLRSDIKCAMRAKQAKETLVLRTVLAAIDNAQAVPTDGSRPASESRAFGDPGSEVLRKALRREDVRELLREEIRARQAAADEMRRMGRADQADILMAEAQIVARYLDS